MSLFTSGDNGTFDSTVDPTGNPPSDWNITKAADAIVKFTDVNPITGTGSMRCESRSIFNDDYALASITAANINSTPYCQLLNTEDFDFTQDFIINIKSYIDALVGGGGRSFFIIEGTGCLFSLQYFAGSSTVLLRWLSSGVVRGLSVASSYQVENNIQVNFNHGVSVDLIVNGTTVTDSVNTLLDNANSFDYIYVGRREEANDRGFDGYIRDFVYTQSGSILRDIKFNQEQGRFAFCTETGINQGELKIWPNEEVQFGGDAWVDTTTL